MTQLKLALILIGFIIFCLLGSSMITSIGYTKGFKAGQLNIKKEIAYQAGENRQDYVFDLVHEFTGKWPPHDEPFYKKGSIQDLINDFENLNN